MNVLSLFDGMGCGITALKRAGFKIDKYYASEIDKHAMRIAKKNNPEIIHVGDVTRIESHKKKIDLLLGGSPCQGFSFAGKQLNFEDPRSKLFFEFPRLLAECRELNPEVYFLLENVPMKKEFIKVISDVLGVDPILINSSLVSAQNRRRLYWTNIPNVTQPEDKGILLRDVLLDDGRGVIKDRGVKSQCLDANYAKGADNHGQRTMIKNSVFSHGLESHRRVFNNKPNAEYFSQSGRVYKKDGKSLSVLTHAGKGPSYICNEGIRKLHPIECERLQTLPDDYTDGVSDTQRYKMLGNGWTIDVIAHILSHIPTPANEKIA